MQNNTEAFQLRELATSFLDPESPSFLQTNPTRILENIRHDANRTPVSLETINLFLHSLSYHSKAREKQLLGSKKRYASYRRYLTFSPGAIITGPPLHSIHTRQYIHYYTQFHVHAYVKCPSLSLSLSLSISHSNKKK